jgi:hypothetical protein
MILSGLSGRATGLDFLLATKRFLKVLDRTMCFNHAFIEKAFGAATPKNNGTFGLFVTRRLGHRER